MDKKITEKVIAVIVGICWIVLLLNCVSLFADVLMMDDSDELLDILDYSELIGFIRWTSLAVVVMLVPTFVCGGLKIFTGNKLFSLICSALHFAVLACMIGFYSKIYTMAKSSEDILQYTFAMEFFDDALIVMVTTAVLCAYYAYESVYLFLTDRKKAKAEADKTAEETCDDVADEAVGGEQ